MDTKRQLAEVGKEFQISGDLIGYVQMHNGNINETYHAVFSDGEERREYMIQKINIYVFHNPKRIMNNIDLITDHIRCKLEEAGQGPDGTMQFLHTAGGASFIVNDRGFWRVYKYIAGAKTYDSTEDLHILSETGRAFGRFQMQLSDFDASQLFPINPNFHNTRSRIAVFFRHVNEDPCGRAGEILPEIRKIQSVRKEAVRINEMLDAEEFPLRVTHNDTKINNVLFDEVTGDAKTVIDLDTVMPGLAMHDFGDGVRFCASTACEDERELGKVGLDLRKFRAFSEGFFGETRNMLTETERSTMALGAFTMTVELAVRFLDDYITGDKYFRISCPDHNLVRGRCQLRLAEDMRHHRGEMERIVRELC